MTVADLLAALAQHPPHFRVVIGHDGLARECGLASRVRIEPTREVRGAFHVLDDSDPAARKYEGAVELRA